MLFVAENTCIMYVYERPNWPSFTYDNQSLLKLLGDVRHLQGKIIGKMEALGFDLRKEASFNTLLLDIVKQVK